MVMALVSCIPLASIQGWQSDVLWVLQIITDPHPPLLGVEHK